MAQKRRAAAPRTSLHQVMVMLEALNQKVDTLAEGWRAGEARLLRTLDERFAEVNRRFEVLEAAVRHNSEAIRQNTAAIERLEQEIRRMDRTLRGKADEEKLAALERRVSALEARLGISG